MVARRVTNPEYSDTEEIENALLREFLIARDRYNSQECSANVYRKAIRQLSGFVMHGKLPNGRTAKAKSARRSQQEA